MSTAAAIQAFLGERNSGLTVRQQNSRAVEALGKIMATSLGPCGLDKMIVDDIGEVVISNDGATILRSLEVKHPAAQTLVDLSVLQDGEVGDGTTSVVLLAAELVKRGQGLVERGIHPTWILQAYKAAGKEAVRYINRNLTFQIDPDCNESREVLVDIAKTSMSSKIIGSETHFFANLVVDAVLKTKRIDSKGKGVYPVGAINIVKSHGSSITESQLIDGFVMANTSRASQAMPIEIENPKIAFLEFPLKQYRAHMGVNILISEAGELEKIREAEKNITRDRIQKILEAGANVILTSEGIDDMSLKYFADAGAIAVRRIPIPDLRRIAAATCGSPVITMAQCDNDEEAFDPYSLGAAEYIGEIRIGDNDAVQLKCGGGACTVVLRGANEHLLDEVERSLHDAFCVVSRALESGSICAGGGAVEAALSVYLEDYARTLGPRVQPGVAEFAEALMVIPRNLAVNAAKDAPELMAQLKACHYKSQTDTGSEDLKWFGLDLRLTTNTSGVYVCNNLDHGVVEPSMIKTKALRFATEASVTLLRVDDLISVKANEGM